MTLLEKIKKLKWFDSISKLRDILEELYNSSSGGSGGNQDLQSVLDNGNTATTLDENGQVGIMQREGESLQTYFFMRDALGRYGEIVVSTEGSGLNGVNGDISGSFGVTNGLISITQSQSTIGGTTLSFEQPITDVDIKIPAPSTSGTYTLATTGDILKINLDSRIYANNAAAITGGLTAKDLYRTSTGELRIVV